MPDHSDLGFTPEADHSDLGFTPEPAAAAPPRDSILQGIVNTGKNIFYGARDLGAEINKSAAGPAAIAGPVGIATDVLRKMVLAQGQAMAEYRAKAEKDFHAGSYMDGIRHALAGTLPLIGPEYLGSKGDRMATDPWTTIGETVTEGLLGAAPSLASDLKLAIKPRLNAVQQSAVNFAERRGIPVPASVQTGSKALRGAEALVRNDLGGSAFAANADEATVRALTREGQAIANQISPAAIGEAQAGAGVRSTLEQDLAQTGTQLANRVLPKPLMPVQAGTNLRDRFLNRIESLHKQSGTNYERAWLAEQDPMNLREVPVKDSTGAPVLDAGGQPQTIDMPLPVDMRQLKDVLAPVAEDYAYTLPETQQRMSPGLHAIKNILKGPDWKPISQAERDLGLLKDAAREDSGLSSLRDESQGLAALTLKKLQDDIEQTMASAHYPGYDPTSGGPHPGLEALRAGRKFTAQKYETGDLLKSIGQRGTKLEDIEPTSLFQGLTWSKDAAIERLRQVKQMFPDSMPEIGRAYIDSGGNWNALGAQTKQELFRDPRLISELGQYYNWGDQIRPLLSKEPARIFDHLTQAGDAGAEMLKRVKFKAPGQVPEIARAYFQGLLDKATAAGDFDRTVGILRSWENLGPETKRALVANPQLRQDVTDFLHLAQTTMKNPNPSGTALVGAIGSHVGTLTAAGGMALWNPGAGAAMALGGEGLHLITNAGLARLLFTPAGSRALIQGLTIPVKSPLAAAAAARLIKMAGSDAVPMPSNGAAPPARRPLSDFHLPAPSEQPTQQQ